MLKLLIVLFSLIVCCYCLDNNEVLTEDARAKKKKNTVRLWAMVLLFVFAKVAVFKVASVMLFMAFFQKIFYLAGLLLTYLMKQRTEKPPATYGPPEYNTIGYSYGPPEHAEHAFPGTEYGLPSLTEVGGSFSNWLFNKNKI